MVHPVIIIGGVLAGGWAIGKAGNALDNASELTKWAVIGGGMYISYRALMASGILK